MKPVLILVPALALLLGSCRSRPVRDAAAPMVGADRDAHGCIGSAGYVWSEVLQECIRPFEAGVRMLPAADPEATSAAYIVFDADSSRAELFLPGQQTTDVLDRRRLPSGGFAWNAADDDTKNVRRIDDLWVIEQRGRPIYVQDVYPIHAVFEGTDGQSDKIYDVRVTFENRLARLTLDGTVFDLPQYVTGSGYGYANAMMDLHGKGREATLTLRDGLTLRLVQKE